MTGMKFEQYVLNTLDDELHIKHFNRLKGHDVTGEALGFWLAMLDSNELREGFNPVAVRDYIDYVHEYVYMPMFMGRVWELNNGNA